jgi:hypothetical protein
VAAKLPCNSDIESDVGVLVGQAPNLTAADMDNFRALQPWHTAFITLIWSPTPQTPLPTSQSKTAGMKTLTLHQQPLLS